MLFRSSTPTQIDILSQINADIGTFNIYITSTVTFPSTLTENLNGAFNVIITNSAPYFDASDLPL